mgnify:CR=1 FL=1|jgi:LemA protein|tara:strand:- start:58 stop:624 length:567 start_codon:yes stop_codon:yes gene_type:complete
MHPLTITLIAIPVVTILWVIATYNKLVKFRNHIKMAFSGIDVQLKRRTDLIPNLINTVKGYAAHEKEVLESLTKARTSIMNGSASGNINEMADGNNMLSGALKSVFAVAENYPDLKANQNFLSLQESLEETEDQVAAARRIYNANVNDLNTKVESFPSVIIASMFGFGQTQLFTIVESDRANIDVNFS